MARVVTTGSRAGKHNGRDREWECASRTKGLESRGPSRGTQDWKSSLDPGTIEGEGDEWATRKKLGLNKERQSLEERRARVERKCRCASARGGPTTLAGPGGRERSVQRRCAATAALLLCCVQSKRPPPCARRTGCDLWRPGLSPRGNGGNARARANQDTGRCSPLAEP